MFFKGPHSKKIGGGILRLFLSLIILVILGIGLYRAYISFSGLDPLTFSPQSIINNLFNSEKTVELITGLLTISPDQSLEKVKEILDDNKTTQDFSKTPTKKSSSALKYKIGVIADPHTDTTNLAKALSQLKRIGVKFVIGIGDFSDVGTVEQLSSTKQEFDKAGLTYYPTPGDHDLWDSRDKANTPSFNFTSVFGTPPYQSFSDEDIRIIIVYDTDNYLGLDGVQLNWIEEELRRLDLERPKLTLVFLGTPLFHPSSDHVMGKANPKLKNQATHLISLFSKHGIAEVIAADTHFFSRYKEPTGDLPMTTIGAVTSVKNPQSSRFGLIDIYEDASYNIEDLEVK